MKFKFNPIKDFFRFYFRSKAARQFRFFGLLILLISLGVFLFWASEISWVAALAVLILFIPLYKKTIGARTPRLSSVIEIRDGILIERHTTSAGGFKRDTTTQTVTHITGICYYKKTGDIEVYGHNELVSGDFHTVISSCYFTDCYGPELLKALEEKFTTITYLKRGGIN